jgi:hypothetical protein
MRAVWLSVALVAFLATGCKHNTTTSPTTTTTTTTTPSTAPTTTEEFDGTLGVGATASYLFTVSQAGSVTATLVSISGAVVPATVQVRLGIGTPDDAGGCTTTTMSLANSASPTLSTTEQPGNYCANITDVGNLAGTAAFVVTIAHS